MGYIVVANFGNSNSFEFFSEFSCLPLPHFTNWYGQAHEDLYADFIRESLKGCYLLFSQLYIVMLTSQDNLPVK